MIEKKTVVDQIEITSGRVVQIRLRLILLEDGKEIDSKWHRTAIVPGASAEIQMKAANVHLQEMGKEPVDPASIDYIKRIAAVAHYQE